MAQSAITIKTKGIKNHMKTLQYEIKKGILKIYLATDKAPHYLGAISTNVSSRVLEMFMDNMVEMANEIIGVGPYTARDIFKEDGTPVDITITKRGKDKIWRLTAGGDVDNIRYDGQASEAQIEYLAFRICSKRNIPDHSITASVLRHSIRSMAQQMKFL